MRYGEPVTFLEAGERLDEYSGETVKDDWKTPSVVLEDVAGIEPLSSTEPMQDGRQAEIVGYRLYFDHTVQVSHDWRCTVRGETWPVTARPAVWRNPFTGWDAGTVVKVGGGDG